MDQWPIYRVMGPEANHPETVDEAVSKKIYEDMVLLRTFDEKSITLQRQGKVGTFPPSIGQEASEIASAHALSPKDWLVPSYRDHGALYVHGVPFENIILFAMGRTGSLAGDVRALPASIPIATHLPHAVGLAMAARQLGEAAVAMAYFGDGGTSEGDFHEALNFAGVFRAPAIFFCQNNGWAISVPVRLQTASATLVQKAEAYGIRGVRVDGNDALAVYQAVADARRLALEGEGPTLIEALTYRLGPHTTADDPTRYRPEEELREWQSGRDPIDRLGAHLAAKGLLDPETTQAIAQRSREWVNQAVENVDRMPPVNPREMFAHVFDEGIPPHLTRQLAELEGEMG